MKNKAFTLAEAMIVLSVVSVLAGLSVVAVSNTKPDESIVMFRKGYSTITKVVNELINDMELYPSAKEPFNRNISLLGNSGDLLGLADTKVTEEMVDKYPCLGNEGNEGDKFLNLFKYKTNAILEAGNNKAFTTPDGIYWIISSRSNITNRNTPVADGILYTTGSTENTCTYNSSTCKIPTAFNFYVYPNGQIFFYDSSSPTKADKMACSYIRYPKINKAKNIPTDSNANSCFAN